MNRRTVSILVAILVLAMLMTLVQSGAMAQGPTQGGSDQVEPPVADPDGNEQADVPVVEPGGDQVEPPLVNPGSDDETEPLAVDAVGPDALVTSAFTYQGQLRSGGAAVNANCDFIWDIYAAAAPGGAVAGNRLGHAGGGSTGSSRP